MGHTWGGRDEAEEDRRGSVDNEGGCIGGDLWLKSHRFATQGGVWGTRAYKKGWGGWRRGKRRVHERK